MTGDDNATQQRIDLLASDGYVRIPNALTPASLQTIQAAVARLEQAYPYGFVNKGVYSDQPAEPRANAPRPDDYAPTIIYPNVGFMEPDIFAPLANPALHALIAAVVGDDYYLSNTWLQCVPPGTGRMGYHKDLRGSVSFVLMLDDIGDEMGSTCLVPGSHLNTPPAVFCMDDHQKRHPREKDLAGKVGDIILFTPETWHARAPNKSTATTRRLFYNFYSRSSKATTSWAKAVSSDDVARAQASLPEHYRKLFNIDAALSSVLQSEGIQARDLADGAKSHDQLFADIRHSFRVYGRPSTHPVYAEHIQPFTTRLTERRRFSLSQYLSQLKLLPTTKIAIRAVLGNQIDLARKMMKAKSS